MDRITTAHLLHPNGDIAGGTSFGPGFCIGWSIDPDRRRSTAPLGATVDSVLYACMDRLKFLRKAGAGCEEYTAAEGLIEITLNVLLDRNERLGVKDDEEDAPGAN